MYRVEATGWCKVPAGRYKFVTTDRKTRTQIEIELPEWKYLTPVHKDELAR